MNELALAAQENLFALLRSLATLPGGLLEETPSFARHSSFPANPMFTGVWACRTPEAVEDGIAWLTAQDAAAAFFWLGPGTEPDGARRALEAAGLQPWDVDSPSMAAEIDALPWELLERVPAGVRIERVESDSQLEDYGQAFTDGFEVPAWAAQAWLEATRALGIAEAPWSLYVGYLDGRPVATSMLVLGGGFAGLYAIGTVPEARRRGIGAAVTLAALREAQGHGYRHAALFSTPEGYPVYRRLGFEDYGAPISRYLWRPGS